MFKRLTAGLLKTSKKLAGRIKDLVAGRKVDADLLDEIEEILITSDVGVEATTNILDQLRSAWEEKEIEEGDQVIPHLKVILKEMLASDGAGIIWADAPPTVVLVAGVCSAAALQQRTVRQLDVARVEQELAADPDLVAVGVVSGWTWDHLLLERAHPGWAGRLRHPLSLGLA